VIHVALAQGYPLAMTAHRGRRQLYPVPARAILDHPEAYTLPAAAYGMLWRIILGFWVSGCRPLPKADFELRSLARAHPPTWRRWRQAILRVFEDIRPELEREFRRRENAARGLKIAAHRGGAANAARLRRRALDQCSPPAILAAVPMRAPTPATAGRPVAAPASPKRFSQSVTRR